MLSVVDPGERVTVFSFKPFGSKVQRTKKYSTCGLKCKTHLRRATTAPEAQGIEAQETDIAAPV